MPQEKRKIASLDKKVLPLGLGTWVFGGWPWTEPAEKDCEATLEMALRKGVALIDTAPIYGFGRGEEIVGKYLRRLKKRESVLISTKTGLSWEDGKNPKIWKDMSRKTILKEIDESLKRLQTDYIDVYQIHWPDGVTPIGESMDTLYELKEAKKISVIGVSNFSLTQLEEALRYAPVEVFQGEYNYFQRGLEKEIMPFCQEKNITTFTYGTLAKGLLTGKFGIENRPQDPVRSPKWDPLFGGEQFSICMDVIEKIRPIAEQANMTLAQWMILWTLAQPGVTFPLVGGRNAAQIAENVDALLQ